MANYQVEDLIADESFQHWVLDENVDAETKTKWENWMQQNASNRYKVEEAVSFLQNFSGSQNYSNQFEKNHLWKNIQTHIQSSESSNEQSTESNFNSKNRISWFRLISAAVVLMPVIGLSWLFFMSSIEVVHKTGNADIKTVKLPDQSKVDLNANSSISYQKPLIDHPWHFYHDDMRKLKLKGEAFFAIKHNKEQPFIVKNNGINVKVLGTEFIVKNRRNNVQVVLKKGSVQLQLPENAKKQQVVLKPNERIIADQKTILKKDTVNVDNYLQWKDKIMVFDNQSLREIGNALEDFYGFNVKFKKNSLARKRFTGKIKTDNLDILIKALEQAHGLSISREENNLIFDNNR